MWNERVGERGEGTVSGRGRGGGGREVGRVRMRGGEDADRKWSF